MTSPEAGIQLRDVTDLDGCEAVVDVQHEVWGEVFELVPASLLVASIKRGGILVGAFGGETLVGFVWSMPGWRDGRPTHWSHMLAVLEAARGGGIGLALKNAQRDRLLSAGIDLAEWTFDPLQARNAHLNISRLGCVASEYLPDVYGPLKGPLHGGAPTDRLVAEWWVTAPQVRRAVRHRGVAGGQQGVRPLALIEARAAGDWHQVASVCTDMTGRPVSILVPAGFTSMLQEAPVLALEWRMATRQVFSASFSAGYEVVDFELNRERGCGQYILAIPEAS